MIEEVAGGAVQRTYTYGLSRISQTQASLTSFYGYDGMGSVRFLTDATGAVTDRYDYDAWGNTITLNGSTQNKYFYRGEEYDSDLMSYYLRARYFNPLTGRFLTSDPASGQIEIPQTFHKYMYASDNPVNAIDPSGREDTDDYAITVQSIKRATVDAFRRCAQRVMTILSVSLIVKVWGILGSDAADLLIAMRDQRLARCADSSLGVN